MLEEQGVVRKFSGLTTDILTDRALQFIRNAHGSDQGKPFLLCLHTRAPHGPWLPVAPQDWEPYASLDPRIPNPDYPDLNVTKMKRQLREYLASVSGVDRNLGRILQLLDSLKIVDNTVVIFTSDHGYNMGHNGIWHKGNGIWATNEPPAPTHRGTRVISRKYRPNLDDQSLRVPLIIRWPNRIQIPRQIEATVSSLDLFPTILEMADASKPEDCLLRGRSLLPLLEGSVPEDWDKHHFAEYQMIHYAEADLRCYRTPEFKLVVDASNQGRNEFFDLREDPAERRNLIRDQRPEIQRAIQDLTRRLEDAQTSLPNSSR